MSPSLMPFLVHEMLLYLIHRYVIENLFLQNGRCNNLTIFWVELIRTPDTHYSSHPIIDIKIMQPM